MHSSGNASSCGIHAICLRMASMLPFSNNVPFKVIRPSLNGINPSMALSNEVFPHPDGPEMLAISPCFSCRLNPEKSILLP